MSPKREYSNMHVVLLIDYLSPTGGGERLAMQIALRLDPARFQRTLCVSRWSEADVERTGVAAAMQQLQDAGVELLPLDRSSPLDLPAWRPLWHRMRTGRVDVLHAHKFGSNVWAAALARTAGVPVVVTHEHNWSYEGQGFRRFLDRELIARRSDAFFAVSRENVRRMIDVEGIDPVRIAYIPNGVPAVNGALPPSHLRAELGLAAGDPVIGTVAGLRPEKAIDVLVHAGALLLPRFPDLKVVIAGGGPEQPRVEALAAELGVADSFRFLGVRDDPARVVDIFDVGVLSSTWEGSPLSIMEFMQAGKPVVATRVGGVPDIVEDGATGLLVTPGDPAALADGIARVLSDPAFAAEAGRRGRERQQTEFDLDVMVSRLEDVYERLYAERGAQSRSRRGRPTTALVRGPLDVELVGSVEAARDDWQRLAEHSPSIFSTWEWASAWWSARGDGCDPLVALARYSPGAEPFALLPLFATNRPVRTVRLIGHSGADELGPVCAPEDRPDAMAAMALSLDFAGDWDLFLADRVEDEHDWRAPLGAQRIAREPMPVLRFDGNFDEFLASRSHNFREQVRRRERRLAAEHDISFRLADDPARLQDDMTALLRLHAAHWDGQGENAFRGPREPLHRDFAARALERGWLRLWFLEVDGAPVAAWYGFRYGGADSFYQSGRDPEWDRWSVGFVLMAHTIRDALDSGVHEYRLLVGDEAYKGRFANAEDHVDTYARIATARGRAALAVHTAKRGLPGSLRRPLRRLVRR